MNERKSRPTDVIGYIIAYPHFVGVCCQACLDGSDAKKQEGDLPIPLRRENVGQYKQTCHGCGKTLVEPSSPLWPELFSFQGSGQRQPFISNEVKSQS